MLIIPRKKGESIVIGDNVIVTVIGIRGDKVRLGIEIPPGMPLHRKEVYDAIHRTASGTVSSQLRKEPLPKFTHAIVFVSDMARSVAFYRDVLGLPLRFESPEWTEFETPGSTLALHLADGPAYSSRSAREELEAPPGTRVLGWALSSLRLHALLPPHGLQYRQRFGH
jgi:carbon storage regulator